MPCYFVTYIAATTATATTKVDAETVDEAYAKADALLREGGAGRFDWHMDPIESRDVSVEVEKGDGEGEAGDEASPDGANDGAGDEVVTLRDCEDDGTHLQVVHDGVCARCGEP